jgi:hypothetical protein
MDMDYCLSAWYIANCRGTCPKVCKGCLFLQELIRCIFWFFCEYIKFFYLHYIYIYVYICWGVGGLILALCHRPEDVASNDKISKKAMSVNIWQYTLWPDIPKTAGDPANIRGAWRDLNQTSAEDKNTFTEFRHYTT